MRQDHRAVGVDPGPLLFHHLADDLLRAGAAGLLVEQEQRLRHGLPGAESFGQQHPQQFVETVQAPRELRRTAVVAQGERFDPG